MKQLDSDSFNAITRLVYEYALGIDTRDWDLYRSIFSDQIHMDFSSYNGNPGADMSADQWVDGVKILFTGLDATQHSMTNPMVDLLEQDRARCRMYMQAEHVFVTDQGDNVYTIGGYYDDQFVYRDGRWWVTAVTLNVLWHRGNRHIMELATARGTERLNA